MTHKIRINYKSGNHIDVECDDFAYTAGSDGNLTKVSWNNLKPEVLWLGINEIESVWVLNRGKVPVA